jgi:hypothetical protein
MFVEQQGPQVSDEKRRLWTGNNGCIAETHAIGVTVPTASNSSGDRAMDASRQFSGKNRMLAMARPEARSTTAIVSHRCIRRIQKDAVRFIAVVSVVGPAAGTSGGWFELGANGATSHGVDQIAGLIESRG